MSVRQASRWRRLWWGRRVGTALVLAAGVAGGVALAAVPAQAASGVFIHPEWVDGCPGCPGPIFLVQRELDQRAVVAVTGKVQAGLSGLVTALHQRDPAAAKKLHEGAIVNLTGAAKLTGYAGFSAVADGDDVELCPRWWPWPIPGPPPWRDVEGDLADGITLIGQAAITKDVDVAAQLRAKGIEELDAGAAGLDAYQGCTG
ncbi:MAG: hypothetical protein V7637_582 [Mycobacteriales bacterium]